jgi:hypothetical protein
MQQTYRKLEQSYCEQASREPGSDGYRPLLDLVHWNTNTLAYAWQMTAFANGVFNSVENIRNARPEASGPELLLEALQFAQERTIREMTTSWYPTNSTNPVCNAIDLFNNEQKGKQLDKLGYWITSLG